VISIVVISARDQIIASHDARACTAAAGVLATARP
jgi:hypothetical protein